MPVTENFTLSQGDVVDLHFNVSPADADDLSPGNLDGAEIYFWLAPASNTPSADVLIKKSLAGGDTEIEVIDSDDMTFDVHLLRDDTLDLEGYFYYETKVVDPLGNVVTPTKGTILIERTLIRLSGE